MKCAVLLPLLLLSAPSAFAQEALRHKDPAFGFEITLPEGWTFSITSRTDSTLSMLFKPASAPEHQSVTLSAERRPDLLAPDDVARAALQVVEGQAMYSDAELGEALVAGRTAPSLVVNASAGGVDYRLRQIYLAEHETRFILQATAQRDDFEDWTERFDALWAGLTFIEVSEETHAARSLERLAARCGSEVEWAADWNAAAARARKTKRPILCIARMYSGFSLSDATMAGPFMDPDVVTLVNARFVPLKLEKGMRTPMDEPDVYGMSGTTFGAALLVVTPDGEVLRDSVGGVLATMLEVTAWRAENADMQTKVDDWTMAEMLLDIGELALAEGVLERMPADEDVEQAALVRARYHRMRGDARAARAAVDVGDTPALRHARAYFDMRLGDFALARRAFAELARDEAHASAPEARFWLGALQRRLGERADAESTWRALADELPEDRWAWRAAAELQSTAHAMGKGTRLDWPTGAEAAEILRVPYAPLPPAAAERAGEDAMRWLREHQRSDGGWWIPADLGKESPELPHHFDLAAAALAGHALLLAGETEAAARALAWLRDAYRRVREAAEPEYLMDYTCWSRPSVLDFLSAAVEGGLAERSELADMARTLVGELDAMQKPTGGWSYYLSGDIEDTSPANVAMSFTSAYVVLALMRARDVGFEVPEEPLERALDALEAMRDETGLYAYMHVPGTPADAGAAAGAAARSPVCTLALVRGGRLPTGELNGALQLFVEHSAGYDKELGKALMHTGAAGQGSHYLLFDYMTAASAIATLPGEERVKYTEPVLEVLLRARTTDGAFVDNPILGRATGTGMALLALRALER